ncbi:hypothetical protein [Tumebacillus permanentifrigoris]|uniref:Uncharacterized protein n=1 Tax=Tumebacillus permanentifrigoris TaxID=378543 RepID=A0A316E023_9BACL|nr:hypothetical protein [Tumebacillus permanentifrigoris]PWK16150.1 hypothetical protein C7459_10110 [Tumebacillus permanentifrigoris]
MNIQTFMQQIVNSSADQWNHISCWGHGSGPSYLSRVMVSNTSNGQTVEVESHSNVASFKEDLSISMAWGFEANDDFSEDWTDRFSDTRASSAYLDFFYKGVLVRREIFVNVDGGRAMLPLPKVTWNASTNTVEGLSITREQYNIFRLIASHVGNEEDVERYEQYVDRAGFTIV